MLIQFTEVEINLLYELKRPHPIVDFVEIICEAEKIKWYFPTQLGEWGKQSWVDCFILSTDTNIM